MESHPPTPLLVRHLEGGEEGGLRNLDVADLAHALLLEEFLLSLQLIQKPPVRGYLDGSGSEPVMAEKGVTQHLVR